MRKAYRIVSRQCWESISLERSWKCPHGKWRSNTLQRFNPGDITIRHHYTGDRLRLHSFRHKGYWYHGRRREQQTMELFRELVTPGSIVVEVGAHIGYVALHLAKLVGPNGKLVVFEPGTNNLDYLR